MDLKKTAADIFDPLGVFGLDTEAEDKQKLWEDSLKQNAGLYNNLKIPDFAWQNIQNAGTYSPEEAKYQKIEEDPRIRQAQMDYLSKLSGLSNTGFTEGDQAAMLQAQLEAQRQARSGREAALQNAAVRGMGGSGLEYAMRAAADQDAANRAQAGGLQAAEAAARQKALYNQAYGGALQNQRAQDFGANSANAGIINQFNMANTGARNQAQQYNIGNQNQLNEFNAANSQAAKQQGYNAELNKIAGQSVANTNLGEMYGLESEAERKRKQALLGGIGGGIGYLAGGGEGAKAGNSLGQFLGGA